jgi:phosphatidylinositol alpha-mannosyltransferase
MKRVLRAGEYDVVHIHSPLTPSLPVAANDVAECPIVGTFHTYLERSLAYRVLGGWLEPRVRRLSASIAVSHAAATTIDRYFDVDWTIIPNGIDTEMFNPRAQPPAGWPMDAPVVLFLGRFDPRNGLSTLIDAFRKVRGRGRRARLVVVGDGPLRNRYYREAGSDPDIQFAGALLDERPEYYANAAVYACPTTKASFGITLLESMACETPVVCSSITGFTEVAEHERDALMFACADSGALADSLVRLLDDDTLRARLGKAGRRKAESYAWPQVTSSILEVYASVLGRTGRTSDGTC